MTTPRERSPRLVVITGENVANIMHMYAYVHPAGDADVL